MIRAIVDGGCKMPKRGAVDGRSVSAGGFDNGACVVPRRHPAELRVRSFFVVVPPPGFQHGPSMRQGAEQGLVQKLVAFDAPCAFQRRAMEALDAAGLPWRHAFATSSLLGVWAAVRAGLGITLRTADAIPPDLREVGPSELGLPDPGSVELVLHRARSASASVEAFADLLLDAVTDGNGQAGPDGSKAASRS